jgi:transcriptional regulator with XRE-family HTH domain
MYIMNEVQQVLGRLKANGWTLAAIADELGVHYNTVQKWAAGDRTPTNGRAVLHELGRLTGRKRIPKRKRYPGKRNPLGS